MPAAETLAETLATGAGAVLIDRLQPTPLGGRPHKEAIDGLKEVK